MTMPIRQYGVFVLWGAAFSFVHGQVPPIASAASVASPAASSNAATLTGTGKIYQQRQKDGSVLFTDRPPAPGSTAERTWIVPAEDPALVEQRREKARQEARQETQAINDRVQRQIERQQDREDAMALERMRLNQAQAQRDAEIARADRERSERERSLSPTIVVLPGHRPPYGGPSPPIVRPRPPVVRPPVDTAPRPSPSLCMSKTADCNPTSEPGRAGFGGR